MKALITGGAGFMGSHLAEALLQRGAEVHVIDDLSTGSIENIEHLKGKERFHYTIDTVLNEPLLAELVDRVDVIFHLAAAVGVRLIVESPVHTIETNVHGTEMVLKLANKKRKKCSSPPPRRSTARPTRALPRGRRPRHGPDLQGALELRLQQGDRRVPRPRLPQGEAAPGGGRAPLQHGGPPADRALRHGGPELRQAGAARPPAHRLRGRHPEPLLHLRDATWSASWWRSPRSRGRWERSSTWATTARRSRSSTSRDGSSLRAASKSPIELVPYDRAYEEGFEDMHRRVPDLSKIRALTGYEPRVHLDEILDRVIAYFTSDATRL